jgi:hypothetical protein
MSGQIDSVIRATGSIDEGAPRGTLRPGVGAIPEDSSNPPSTLGLVFFVSASDVPEPKEAVVSRRSKRVQLFSLDTGGVDAT